MNSQISALNPIIVCFAYSRPLHLHRSLHALSQNPEAKALPIIIFIDVPDSGGVSNLVTKKLVAIANSFQASFDSFEIITRPVNFGLYKSITEGITYALQHYDEVIVIEDDIVVSACFLKYVLVSLAIYKDIHSVASVHGYCPPVGTVLPPTFFLPGADCWGWATWRDRWLHFDADANRMFDEINARGLKADFDFDNNANFSHMLYQKAQGLNNSWAICWHAANYLAGKYTLHPGVSMVENIGLDSTGVHCGNSPQLNGKLASELPKILQLPPKTNVYARQAFAAYYSSLKPDSQLITYFRKIVNFINDQKKSTLSMPLYGPYGSFESALMHSTGYDSPNILFQSETAMKLVLNGDAIYERDGVAFSSFPPNHSIEQILSSYLKDDDIVVDYGGSLGSLYINHRHLFSNTNRQVVVEQSHFVLAGRQICMSYDLPIEFFTSFEDINIPTIDVAVFSSVLMYVQDWTAIINDLLRMNPRLIIIDRTCFDKRFAGKWWIQDCSDHYNTKITIPFKSLDLSTLKRLISTDYDLICEWENDFDCANPVHSGLLFKRY